MSQAYVNICMVTFNRLEFTKQAINSIVVHTKHPHVLTVVDNNSSDGTQQYLSELRDKGVIKNLILSDQNNGVAKGSNMAWCCEPDAPYYLKFDNDMVVQKDNWLAPMLDIIDAIPFLGALGYNVEPISYPLTEIDGMCLRLKSNNIGGACFLIPKRTERLLGQWSEGYSLSGEEDVDYCERVRLIGLVHAYMEDQEMMFHLPAGKAARIDPDDYTARDGKEEIQHSEYRVFKDKQRYKVIKEEKRLEKNFHAYYCFAKPLYEKENQQETWTTHDRSTLMKWVFTHNAQLLQEKQKHSKELAHEGVILLADLYVKNQDYTQGKMWVKRAIGILQDKNDKTDEETYKLASYLKLVGKNEEARVLFEWLVGRVDDSRLRCATCFHLGEIYYDLAQYREASESLQQCIALNPTHRKAKEYLDAIATQIGCQT